MLHASWTVHACILHSRGGLKIKKISKFHSYLKLFAFYIFRNGEFFFSNKLMISWAQIGLKIIRTTI